MWYEISAGKYYGIIIDKKLKWIIPYTGLAVSGFSAVKFIHLPNDVLPNLYNKKQ